MGRRSKPRDTKRIPYTSSSSRSFEARIQRHHSRIDRILNARHKDARRKRTLVGLELFKPLQFSYDSDFGVGLLEVLRTFKSEGVQSNLEYTPRISMLSERRIGEIACEAGVGLKRIESRVSEYRQSNTEGLVGIAGELIAREAGVGRLAVLVSMDQESTSHLNQERRDLLVKLGVDALGYRPRAFSAPLGFAENTEETYELIEAINTSGSIQGASVNIGALRMAPRYGYA